MAFLPTAPSLTLLRNSPPSTLAWRYPARHAGSHLTTVAPPSATPLSSSPSQAHGHETSLVAIVSPPSLQHSGLNTIFTSTATHNVMVATSLATTPYAVTTRPAVASVLVPTPRGTTLVPPPPATRRAALAHTPRLSVSSVPSLMNNTLPSAPSVLPLSPVRGVGRLTRCTSTEGLFAPPLLWLCPITFWSACPFSPEDRGLIPSPHLVFYCSHPWPVGLTRQRAWSRNECGGVGAGGSFPFTFWLAHFNVLAHPSPVFAQCPPTPGSLQLCWVLHPSAASHRSPCYCTIYRSGQR